MTHTIKVSRLTIYPVKSLRGIDVDQFQLGATGPEFDRQWMVVQPNGIFITQRKLAKMCLINTTLDNGELVLSHAEAGQMAAPKGGGEQAQVQVWKDTVVAQDCGDSVASWLSGVLGKECRLVYMPAGSERSVPGTASSVGFADAYPLLLANQQSLRDFNQHLPTPVTMDRFRPNVVVEGSAAYQEDEWQQIAIGDYEFTVESPCTRCIMPSIDPDSGEKQPFVIDALNQHRRFGQETRFGQNVTYPENAVIAVGDPVRVIQ